MSIFSAIQCQDLCQLDQMFESWRKSACGPQDPRRQSEFDCRWGCCRSSVVRVGNERLSLRDRRRLYFLIVNNIACHSDLCRLAPYQNPTPRLQSTIYHAHIHQSPQMMLVPDPLASLLRSTVPAVEGARWRRYRPLMLFQHLIWLFRMFHGYSQLRYLFGSPISYRLSASREPNVSTGPGARGIAAQADRQLSGFKLRSHFPPSQVYFTTVS